MPILSAISFVSTFLGYLEFNLLSIRYYNTIYDIYFPLSMFMKWKILNVIKLVNDFNEFKTSGKWDIIMTTKIRIITILQKYLDE